MSEPSNIRINPFVGDGGTTTYINLTETHIIPSVSPYVIRLNEVPEKQDPSNIRAVWVDSSTGAVTASALTEVAATPAAGEFRPDYSTKADGNDNWNTGLIEFSAVDAGKVVQISYTGIGTLAAVQSIKYPSWYTDRGDGVDGDFIPNANCYIGGVKNYKNVYIKAGITVKINKQLVIKATGVVIIKGVLNGAGGDARGATSGTGASAGGAGGKAEGITGENGTGGGSGGAGGFYDGGSSLAGGRGGYGGGDIENRYAGNGGGGGGGAGGSDSGSPYGGGGGAGGYGITIIANEVSVSGKITANGGNGGTTKDTSGGGGGGGGGDIFVAANAINNSGAIIANGGIGGKGSNSKLFGADGEAGTITIKQLGAL